VVLVARSKTEAAKSKVESAVALGGLGAGLGGPLGGALGAGIGLIIGDGETVFPLDMVAIPAYQAYMISGSPSLQVYIRAGETLMPTGGNVRDVQEAMQSEIIADSMLEGGTNVRGRKKKITAYQRKYKKAFAQVKPKHMKKDGTWKKGGFKAAVKAAHRMCK
jgi:hypothetical protein